MMVFEDWLIQVKKWAHEGNFKTIAMSAKKRLEAKGYVDLGFGSYYRWMLEDWFDKAIKENILKKNVYGQYVLVVDARQEDEVVGKRGKTNIYEKKKIFDLTRFQIFFSQYEDFLKSKNISQYELKNIIDSYKNELV